MFSIVAVPFEALKTLPSAEHRWLLTCFSRYVDKLGRAFPSLRRLASDARMSLATVSRRMTDMDELGVFQREREPGGRYHYVLAEAYRPHWPGKRADRQPQQNQAVPAQKQGVSDRKQGVPQAETQKANSPKQTEEVSARPREGAPITAPSPVAAPASASTTGFAPPVDPWRARVRQFSLNPGQWLAKWGPMPGQPGCSVSAAILAAFGFPTG